MDSSCALSWPGGTACLSWDEDFQGKQRLLWVWGLETGRSQSHTHRISVFFHSFGCWAVSLFLSCLKTMGDQKQFNWGMGGFALYHWSLLRLKQSQSLRQAPRTMILKEWLALTSSRASSRPALLLYPHFCKASTAAGSGVAKLNKKERKVMKCRSCCARAEPSIPAWPVLCRVHPAPPLLQDRWALVLGTVPWCHPPWAQPAPLGTNPLHFPLCKPLLLCWRCWSAKGYKIHLFAKKAT